MNCYFSWNTMIRINFFYPYEVRKLSALVAMACVAVGHVQAQNSTVGLRQVVVSGSRNEQLRDDLPMSVDVMTDRDLEDRQVGDIKDLVKDLPNVSVKHAPARFTVTGASNPTGRDGNA